MSDKLLLTWLCLLLEVNLAAQEGCFSRASGPKGEQPSHIRARNVEDWCWYIKSLWTQPQSDTVDSLLEKGLERGE